MKAESILVIDTPESCEVCPLYSEDDYGYGCGYGTLTYRRRTPLDDTKPSWCPLRPLPKKKKTGGSQSWMMEYRASGWNACLDEITGEEE